MQKDLFKDFQVEEEKNVEPIPVQETRPSFFERTRINLTLDKMILWALINITSIVFIYSFGVEQGMKLAKRTSHLDNRQETTLTTGEETSQRMQDKRTEVLSAASKEDPQKIAQNLEPAPASTNVQPVTMDPSAEKKDNIFTIQLVTYRSETQANREVERLNQKGHQAFIIPSGKFYQVCVDRFEGKGQALQKLVELRMGGYQRIYQGAYVRPMSK